MTYKCMLCGRDRFTSKQPHKCRGGFRKRGIVWEPIKSNTMTLEQVAQVAHEINKAYCESIGDNSQPSWDDAPDWQKESAIHGVDFHLNNPDATPEKSHEMWCIEKANAGWKWGPVKDAEKKEHPCFCLYSELPLEQRVKDHLFKQIVHSLKPYIG